MGEHLLFSLFIAVYNGTGFVTVLRFEGLRISWIRPHIYGLIRHGLPCQTCCRRYYLPQPRFWEIKEEQSSVLTWRTVFFGYMICSFACWSVFLLCFLFSLYRYHIFYFSLQFVKIFEGKDSSEGVVTRLRGRATEESSFDSWQGQENFLFSKTSRLTGAHPSLYLLVCGGSFSSQVKKFSAFCGTRS
jgi:hypothetical protein